MNDNSTRAPLFTLPTVATPGTAALATVQIDAKGRVRAISAAATTGSGSVVLATGPTLAHPALSDYLQLANSSAPGTPSSASCLFIDASNRLSWKGTNGYVRTFDGTANSADRVYVLPDTAGTIALTGDVAAMVALAPGSSLRNVIQPSGDFVGLTVNGFSTSQVALLAKLQKSDGAGYFQVDASGKVQLQGDTTVASRGAELVTNGDFTTDLSGWTATTWTAGTARANYAGTTGPAASVLLNTGGTGYTAGDVLTLTNGANDATATVSTVSSGAITAVSLTNAGTACTVNAAVSATGGTGTGAQFAIVRLADSANTLSQAVGAVNGGFYQIVYTVALSAGQLLVTLGGVSGHRVLAAGTFTQVIAATGTGSLIFTPTADFTGSVDAVSVKLISTTTAPHAILNSDGTYGNEWRAGGAALNNAFSGYRAGFATITGSSNVGLGVNALLNNISGGSNVAAGAGALQNNTIGNTNVAVGASALQNNTTGNFLVAVGASALQNNTTGSSSVAAGINALQANTTGSNSIAIGANALLANTTGNNSVAVGVNALKANTTATGSVALGANALLHNTIGNTNVAAGANALLANTSGVSNVAVGVNALQANISGGSSVAIGASAGFSETSSNKLYISNSNTMTPLVWGDFSAGQLATSGSFGVRTQNPTAAIDAVGTTAASSAFAQKLKQTGAELITVTTDRDFSGANNWTGANWATTAAAFLHTAGSTADAVLANTNLTTAQIISGEMYLVVFTIASATAGTVTPKLGTAAVNAVGQNTTYSQWIVANANNSNLIFTPTTDFNGSIDNISVKRLALLLTVDNTGSAKKWIQDAGTNAVVNALQVGHNSTGTVTTNFGAGVLGVGQSDTTVDRSMARWRWFYTTATDASRKARAVLSAFDTAERDALAIEASGSAAMIGFLGAAPVVRQTTYTQTYSTTVTTVNPASTSAFTGQTNAIAGSVYAKSADLEQLRQDVIQLFGIVNKRIDDDQAYGLAG